MQFSVCFCSADFKFTATEMRTLRGRGNVLTNTKRLPRSLQTSVKINTQMNNYNALMEVNLHVDKLTQVLGNIVKMIL